MSTPRRSTRSTAGIGAGAAAVASGQLLHAKVASATSSSSATTAVVPPPSKKRKTGTRQVAADTASAAAAEPVSAPGHGIGAVRDGAAVRQKQDQGQGLARGYGDERLGQEPHAAGWTLEGEQDWTGTGVGTGTRAQDLLGRNQTISHHGLGEHGYNHGHGVSLAQENGHHSRNDNGDGNAGPAGVSGDSLSLEQGQGQVQPQARGPSGEPLSSQKRKRPRNPSPLKRSSLPVGAVLGIETGHDLALHAASGADGAQDAEPLGDAGFNVGMGQDMGSDAGTASGTSMGRGTAVDIGLGSDSLMQLDPALLALGAGADGVPGAVRGGDGPVSSSSASPSKVNSPISLEPSGAGTVRSHIQAYPIGLTPFRYPCLHIHAAENALPFPTAGGRPYDGDNDNDSDSDDSDDSDDDDDGNDAGGGHNGDGGPDGRRRVAHLAPQTTEDLDRTDNAAEYGGERPLSLAQVAETEEGRFGGHEHYELRRDQQGRPQSQHEAGAPRDAAQALVSGQLLPPETGSDSRYDSRNSRSAPESSPNTSGKVGDSDTAASRDGRGLESGGVLGAEPRTDGAIGVGWSESADRLPSVPDHSLSREAADMTALIAADAHAQAQAQARAYSGAGQQMEDTAAFDAIQAWFFPGDSSGADDGAGHGDGR